MGRRRLAGLAVLVIVAVALVAVLAGGGSPGGGRLQTTPATSTPEGPPPAPQPPARPAPAREGFGANVNFLFDTGSYGPGAINTQLRALAGTGATLARTDALWEAAEPSPPVGGAHHYSWTFDDRIAAALASHGLTWLPIVDYTAPWDQSVHGQDHSPPADPEAYAAYAGALAARYGTGGTFWRSHPELPSRPADTYEIWNEPDNPEFWNPAPDPSRYADLYLAARAAILRSDPSARAIVGGLTHPDTFVPAILAARPALRGQLDGVAVHPYGNPLVVLSKLRSDRAALDDAGLGSVPLYVTEFGWTTSPPGTLNYAPASRRPGYIEATMSALGHLDCGLAAAVLYTWVTPQHNPGDREDWYGIHGPDGAPTPASAAFARGVHNALAPGETEPLCPAKR